MGGGGAGVGHPGALGLKGRAESSDRWRFIYIDIFNDSVQCQSAHREEEEKKPKTFPHLSAVVL